MFLLSLACIGLLIKVFSLNRVTARAALSDLLLHSHADTICVRDHRRHPAAPAQTSIRHMSRVPLLRVVGELVVLEGHGDAAVLLPDSDACSKEQLSEGLAGPGVWRCSLAGVGSYRAVMVVKFNQHVIAWNACVFLFLNSIQCWWWFDLSHLQCMARSNSLQCAGRADHRLEMVGTGQRWQNTFFFLCTQQALPATAVYLQHTPAQEMAAVPVVLPTGLNLFSERSVPPWMS